MIKQLCRVFYRELQSIKYLKRSKLQKILINVASVFGIVAIFCAVLSPLLVHAQDIVKVIPINISYLTMGIGMIIVSLLSLISSFGFLYSSGYLDKNLENYVYMPIKARDFVLAKFAVTYSSVAMLVALAMLPITIISIAFGGFDILLIFSAILFTATIPLITNYIALVLVGTVMVFLNKLSNKTLARNVLYGLFFALLLSINFIISFSMSSVGEDPAALVTTIATLMNSVKHILFYPTWAMEIFTLHNYINILWMISACLVGAVSLLYFEKVYYKGAIGFAADYYKSKNKKYSDSQVKQRGMKSWFFYLEAKQIFKTSSYFFNTIFSNILIVVIYLGMMGFAYFSADKDALEVVGFIKNIADIYTVFLIGVCVSCFMATFNTGAATTYSREAYNLEAYKSMPIDMKSAYVGKVAFHFIIEYLTSFIFMVVPLMILGFGIEYILVMMLAVLLVSLAYIFIPINADFRFPTLEWESDVMVVKGSKSIWVSMITNLILSIIIIGSIIIALFVLNLDHKLICAVATVVLVAMFVILYTYYKKLINKVF